MIEFLDLREDVRKKVFIASKSKALTYSNMLKDVHKSLETLQTDYIDLYLGVHAHKTVRHIGVSAEAEVFDDLTLFGFLDPFLHFIV